MNGNAPQKRSLSCQDRTKRVLSALYVLGCAFISSTSTSMAADYGASNSEAATNVPWMVEDQQSATNWYRTQDSGVPQATLPRPEATQPRAQLTGNSEVEQWSGRRKRTKSFNQDAFTQDPALRKPDRFADNPQLDTDGVRHFANGKHFDLSKISIDQAVDTANASTLGNKPRPDQGNRPNPGNQLSGGMASSSFPAPWGSGGNFGTGHSGNYGNASSGNFGNASSGDFGNASGSNFGNASSSNFGNGSNGNFGNGSNGNFGNGSSSNFGNGSTGNFGNGPRRNFGNGQRGNFGNGRGQFSNSGQMTPQRMQRREARRLARMIRDW
jgi:hypothetical protein